jgi:hypothetical protein
MKSLFFARLLALLMSAYAMAAGAALNDVMPGDFVALSAGRGVTTTYLYDRHQEGTWSKGMRQGNLVADSQVVGLRLSRFYEVGGVTVSPVAVAGFTATNLSGTLPAWVSHHRSGFADMRFGLTGWFINDATSRHYLGLNLMTFWPSGRYENSEIANPGENRRRQALTLGWIKGLGHGWTVELTPELAWYGTTDRSFPGNVKMEQSRTVSLTGYVRHRFTPALEGFVGMQANEGGETKLNGIPQNNPIHGRRSYVGGTWTVNAGNLLTLRYGEDDSVTTGVKTTHEIVARWVHLY